MGMSLEMGMGMEIEMSMETKSDKLILQAPAYCRH